eukprot:g8617.t1
MLKLQEIETLQPMQVRRLNIHQRQYQYRTKTLKNFINNNVDKTCNSDVNFWVDVDPPELPDKLRNIQPNKSKPGTAGTNRSSNNKRKNNDDMAHNMDTNRLKGIDNKKQKLAVIQNNNNTTLLTAWKDSIQTLLSNMSKKQQQRNNSNGVKDDVSNMMEGIVKIIQEAASKNIPQKSMKSMCTLLQLHFDENDGEMFEFFVSLGDKVGGTSYNTIVNTVLYPRIIGLKRTASRSLMNTINEINKNSPRALLTAIMIPLITIKKTDDANRKGNISQHMSSRSPQIELLTRILKFTTPSIALLFLAASLRDIDNQQSDKEMLPWNEFTFPLLKALLSKPLNFNDNDNNQIGSNNNSICKKIIDKIEKSSTQFAKSLKFASVINTLIVKHKDVAKMYTVSLERALRNTNTFLSKTSLKLLNKL